MPTLIVFPQKSATILLIKMAMRYSSEVFFMPQNGGVIWQHFSDEWQHFSSQFTQKRILSFKVFCEMGSKIAKRVFHVMPDGNTFLATAISRIAESNSYFLKLSSAFSHSAECGMPYCPFTLPRFVRKGK
jgi:hypothetical protein